MVIREAMYIKLRFYDGPLVLDPESAALLVLAQVALPEAVDVVLEHVPFVVIGCVLYK